MYVIVLICCLFADVCLKEESKSNSGKLFQHHEPRYQQYHHHYGESKTLLYHPVESSIKKNIALQGDIKDLNKEFSNQQINEEINVIHELRLASDTRREDIHYLADQAMNRSVEYCNPPEKLKLGDEG